MEHDEASLASHAPLTSLAEKSCFALSRFYLTRLQRFGIRHRAPGARFESSETYDSERVSKVEGLYALFSQFCELKHKTVLDLGCSTGYILNDFQKHEPFIAIGADNDPKKLSLARASYGNSISFVQFTPTSIPLPDDSVDIIFTADTVEHLSRPKEIFTDCYRILRPGGLFLVHFHPWLGPWGSRLEGIIPLPWPHVVFSMDTLLKVAAHLYESEFCAPACYWLDEDTGKRRPNPYLDREAWREFLNHMTIRQFRRLIRALPFQLVHFQPLGFGGKTYPLARFLRGFASVPVLNEFFVNAIFCVLQKPVR